MGRSKRHGRGELTGGKLTGTEKPPDASLSLQPSVTRTLPNLSNYSKERKKKIKRFIFNSFTDSVASPDLSHKIRVRFDILWSLILWIISLISPHSSFSDRGRILAVIEQIRYLKLTEPLSGRVAQRPLDGWSGRPSLSQTVAYP